jgi:magnesium transporter
VLASGGNSGSQSATLIIRSMSLGELNRSNQNRIIRREVATGVALGTAMGLLALVFSVQYVPWTHALVVGGTIALVVTFGTTNGTLLPNMLRRLGFDPALMSNPLIASLSDALGVLIYYNVALLFLRSV